jgi:hypothetical protein
MTKFIFMLFLFFCSLQCFSQNGLSTTTKDKSNFSAISGEMEKEKIEAVKIREMNETEIELLFKDNLCEILAIKVSDLLNESMLKKLKANV